MPKFEKSFIRLALIHWCIVTGLSVLFRGYLVVAQMGGDHQGVTFAFFSGLLFDTAGAVYSFLPFALLLVLVPNYLLTKIGSRRLVAGLVAVDVFVYLFFLASEYFFYDEFTDRFNFIAVDYLVYTNEVLGNVWQSYPLIRILGTLALVTAAIVYVLNRTALREIDFVKRRWWSGWRAGLAYAIAFAVTFGLVTESSLLASTNAYEELLAKNGLHALFAAYRNNEIKFDRFYTTMDSRRATEGVHAALKGDLRRARGGTEDLETIVRNITEPEPFNKLNVVVVLMESLSAKFMKAYGNPNDLTPNLDRLTREGLFFDRVYATGTRTVRGIEAVVLSIPPTPGQSIVRRPAGVGLFNIGTPFREQGYKTNFIYGGRAIFDNMGTFFSGNGFEVFDQSTFPSGEITFSNAWGVSDEDLYNQVLKISDDFHNRGDKFMHVVLNTTNHRPYTYPDNKVAIPSGTGRDGAVLYTDYAIGKFLDDAKKKPWFNDTLFVFVADHNAAVAGQRNINPNEYLIPLIFYSPKWIKPEVVHKLGSQIDLAPTLLEFLSASYQSRFFGMELQVDDPKRAFVGTYQNVGYLTETSLTVLGPNRKVEEFSWDGKVTKLLRTSTVPQLPANASVDLTATVSFYKTASDWFSKALLQEKRRIASDINSRD